MDLHFKQLVQSAVADVNPLLAFMVVLVRDSFLHLMTSRIES